MNKLIDASVVIAALIEGNTSAQKVMNSPDAVYLIELTKIEVANILSRKYKSLEEVSFRLEILEQGSFHDIPVTMETIASASRIAISYGTTVYDALYHSAALEHGLIFCTLDRKYYAKTQVLGNIELID